MKGIMIKSDCHCKNIICKSSNLISTPYLRKFSTQSLKLIMKRIMKAKLTNPLKFCSGDSLERGAYLSFVRGVYAKGPRKYGFNFFYTISLHNYSKYLFSPDNSQNFINVLFLFCK